MDWPVRVNLVTVRVKATARVDSQIEIPSPWPPGLLEREAPRQCCYPQTHLPLGGWDGVIPTNLLRIFDIPDDESETI